MENNEIAININNEPEVISAYGYNYIREDKIQEKAIEQVAKLSNKKISDYILGNINK